MGAQQPAEGGAWFSLSLHEACAACEPSWRPWPRLLSPQVPEVPRSLWLPPLFPGPGCHLSWALTGTAPWAPLRSPVWCRGPRALKAWTVPHLSGWVQVSAHGDQRGGMGSSGGYCSQDRAHGATATLSGLRAAGPGEVGSHALSQMWVLSGKARSLTFCDCGRLSSGFQKRPIHQGASVKDPMEKMGTCLKCGQSKGKGQSHRQ